jgi:hypothetical protein
MISFIPSYDKRATYQRAQLVTGEDPETIEGNFLSTLMEEKDIRDRRWYNRLDGSFRQT